MDHMVKMVQLMDYLVHDLNGHSREYAQAPIMDKNTQPKAHHPVPSTDYRPPSGSSFFWARGEVRDVASIWTIEDGREPTLDSRALNMDLGSKSWE